MPVIPFSNQVNQVGPLLQWGASELSFLEPAEARLECERILEFVSSLRVPISCRPTGNWDEAIPLERLLRRPDDLLAMTAGSFEAFSELVRRRKERIPLAYLLGEAYFWDGRFQVEPGVLIPRPETETLIEAFLNHGPFKREDPFSFLDLGTGSGIIAITLAGLLPNAKGTASDISGKALKIARGNVRGTSTPSPSPLPLKGGEGWGEGERLQWLQADCLFAFGRASFDVIFSNPPYVSSEDWESLEPEVKCEPPLALDGGKDGLDFYRRVLGELNCLKPGGSLWVEVGAGQAGRVRTLFEEAGFNETQIFKDLNGIERVVAGKGFING